MALSSYWGANRNPGRAGHRRSRRLRLRGAEVELPLALTANTESCGASLLPWHLGHSAFCFPYTSASNW